MPHRDKLPRHAHRHRVNRPASWRNIWIFVVVVLGLGNLGGLYFDAAGGLGGLLFILAPPVTGILLRLVGGDGWGDTGFGLGRSLWAYPLALAYVPLLISISLALGMAFGQVAIGKPGPIAAAMLAIAGPYLLYAVMEEIGWRGYLEPRLAELGVAPLRRHALVGLVWALWHIGMILSQPGYSTLPDLLFWPLMFAAVITLAFVHGWLRAVTGSIWPNVVLHAAGNVFAIPLLDPANVEVGNQILFAPRLEGLVVLALSVAGAVWFMAPARRA